MFSLVYKLLIVFKFLNIGGLVVVFNDKFELMVGNPVLVSYVPKQQRKSNSLGESYTNAKDYR